jgi:hypothetical protein
LYADPGDLGARRELDGDSLASAAGACLIVQRVVFYPREHDPVCALAAAWLADRRGGFLAHDDQLADRQDCGELHCLRPAGLVHPHGAGHFRLRVARRNAASADGSPSIRHLCLALASNQIRPASPAAYVAAKSLVIRAACRGPGGTPVSVIRTSLRAKALNCVRIGPNTVMKVGARARRLPSMPIQLT